MLSTYRLRSKKTILTLIMVAMTCISAGAYEYDYSFDNTPISEAIIRICKDHPDVNITFIYKELDNYKTSARIHTDDAYEALRLTIGLNISRHCNMENSAIRAEQSVATTTLWLRRQ